MRKKNFLMNLNKAIKIERGPVIEFDLLSCNNNKVKGNVCNTHSQNFLSNTPRRTCSHISLLLFSLPSLPRCMHSLAAVMQPCSKSPTL